MDPLNFFFQLRESTPWENIRE